MSRLSCILGALWALLVGCPPGVAVAATANAGPPFGELTLVDEVLCGGAGEGHDFAESLDGASRVQTILGRPCRVLPNEGGAKYFAYRMGAGKGLRAGAAYVLSVEYPEDRPRTVFVLNRGCETARGFHTGAALGDVVHTYTDNNLESLKVPLSGRFETWKTLFHLHDRFPGIELPRSEGVRPFTPEDGFWVIVAQSRAENAPLSAGAAVLRIRLFAVPDPSRYDLSLRLPPDGLPRRHLFWREEMSDGAVHSREVDKRGVINEIDWYEHKARLMKFLGIDTFCKDLLEFGHNQGWDSAIYGGNDWVNQTRYPGRWAEVLGVAARHGFDVLPYYEYAGSIGRHGLGSEKRCVTLGGGDTYTHITWSEKANADVTDPDTLEDAKRILEATIVRHADKVNFLGAWFRTRPSHIPISFSDRCLGLFAVDANGGTAVSREELRADKQLIDRYYAWWFGERREFLVALRDYLRSTVNPDAVVLFTADTSEPGRSLPGDGMLLVTDDPASWDPMLRRAEQASVHPAAWEDVVRSDRHLEALLSPPATWAQWEWQHSCPQADPANYARTGGVLMTYSFNRAYTVSSARAFDAFRGPSGLALVRHYSLNENAMEKKLGYFVCDVERAGPFCMLGEARAVAYGDPRYIGYLAASSFNRGFPEHVRAFNAAFLSLPALPGVVEDGACADPEVVVRVIRTIGHGTYLAVVNVGFEAKEGATVVLPAAGSVTDAPTGAPLQVTDGNLRLSLGPCELRALHIE